MVRFQTTMIGFLAGSTYTYRVLCAKFFEIILHAFLWLTIYFSAMPDTRSVQTAVPGPRQPARAQDPCAPSVRRHVKGEVGVALPA